MSDKKNFVAVLPDGTEHFEELSMFSPRGWSHHDYERVCENAVRNARLTTPRNNPDCVKVDLFVVSIQNGSLNRHKVGNYSITPPLERMTDSDFNAEMRDILGEIPEEFHSYVSSESWDRGHSAGYEECVSIARSIVFSLKPCIESYRVKLQAASGTN